MKVLAVITARGGSKGVPGKNIKVLCGKPLLAYTAEAALTCGAFHNVMLSTDDEGIAKVGKDLGLSVPYLRPTHLAQDSTPTVPVLINVLEYYKSLGETFDALCLLQPTSPLRTAQDIKNCIKMLEEGDLDAVISVREVPHEYNPHWVYFEDGPYLKLSTGEETPIPRRQSLPTAYHRDGAVYLCKTNCLVENGSLYGPKLGGYLMPKGSFINIDTIEDWVHAEKVMVEVSQLNHSKPSL